MPKAVKSGSEKKCCGFPHKCWGHAGQSNSVYGLGFIGALIYFLSGATTFSDYIIGILKAMFWPAFIVYKLFSG